MRLTETISWIKAKIQGQAANCSGLRIDDRKDYPKYGDRYNNRFVLNPGMNHISLPLDTLRTSSTGQKLNLRNIRRLIIFVARPQAKTVLFVDYIRLSGPDTNEKGLGN